MLQNIEYLTKNFLVFGFFKIFFLSHETNSPFLSPLIFLNPPGVIMANGITVTV